jgi:hypothetical protein
VGGGWICSSDERPIAGRTPPPGKKSVGGCCPSTATLFV